MREMRMMEKHGLSLVLFLFCFVLFGSCCAFVQARCS
jgi:hypothetical protein